VVTGGQKSHARAEWRRCLSECLVRWPPAGNLEGTAPHPQPQTARKKEAVRLPLNYLYGQTVRLLRVAGRRAFGSIRQNEGKISVWANSQTVSR
jgi:hypothetical protein